jgi:Family of unknown function (DUF6161)
MVESESPKPWLTIEHPHFGRREFAQPIDVANWIYQEETPAWQQIKEAIPDRALDTKTLAIRMVTAFAKAYSNVVKAMEEARDRGPEAVSLAAEKEIRIAFDGDCLSASMPQVQFLLHSLNCYPAPLVYGLADFILKRRLAPNELEMSPKAGQLLGLLQEEHVIAAGNYEPIRQLHADWTRSLEDAKAVFKGWLEDAANRADDLEKRYRQLKAIEEPITYWEEKKKRHRRNGVWAAVAFAATAIIGGAALILWMAATQNSFETITGTDRTVLLLKFAQPLLGKFLTVLGLFWVLRILSRVLLAQLHLYADADERVVMGNTYVSLLLGGGILEGRPGIDREDLTIILSQLFRPTTSGIFPDDVAPQIPIAELTKLGKSSGGEH